MISYEYINNELETLHKLYCMQYWNHLVYNTSLDIKEMKSIQESAHSLFHNKEINDYIKHQQFETRDKQNKRKLHAVIKLFFSKTC